MIIHGLAKTTLLDYPGHIACTIFLGGCNFLCPFCHNKDLVIEPNLLPTITDEEVFDFLQKRKGILEGVCITGGEPTLRKDLPSFIAKIKDLGFKIKLDTNGTNPDILKYLCDNKMIDYVAMDIKNSQEKYKGTIGVQSLDLNNIMKSITYLQTNPILFEFRTTVVKELHSKEDLITLAKEISGHSHYFLQSFVSSDNQIRKGFSSYSLDELTDILHAIKVYLPNASLRGV